MNRQKAVVLWFSGLSGAGKSTISEGAAVWLSEKGFRVCLFDGDAIRQQLHKDHGYHANDIINNNRQIAELCLKKRFDVDAILVSIISPLERGRQLARSILGDRFYIVYCKADVQTVCRRDVKGLYAKARAGIIKEFTGISDPYEEPENAEIVIQTEELTPDLAAQRILIKLESLGFIR